MSILSMSWAAALTCRPRSAVRRSAATSLPGPAFPAFASARGPDRRLRRRPSSTSASASAKLEKHPADARWLAAWDDVNAAIEDSAGPASLLENVHPDKAIRDAAQACSQRWTEFGSSLSQNQTLYRAAQAGPAARRHRSRVRRLRTSRASRTRRRRCRRRSASAPSCSATASPTWAGSTTRASATRTSRSLSRSRSSPASRSRSGRTSRATTPDGCCSASTVRPCGRWSSAPTRHRPASDCSRAKLNEGGDANLALLAEIARLRREYAQLFGMKTFADFQLRRRMIESTDEGPALPRRGARRGHRARAARPRRAARRQGAPPRHAAWRRRSSSTGTSPTTANVCAASATASTRRRSAATSRPRRACASS